MESFLNERRVQQGEDWNLDIQLSQSQTEYIPFIVGKRENPHWVITVASTKFEKNNRYVESWWLALGGATPMFKQTTPQYIGELTKAPSTINDIPFGIPVTWDNQTWNGLSSFSGQKIWTDGTDIYYSDYNSHYILDRSTKTWNSITFFYRFDGGNVWHDGANTYLSVKSSAYVESIQAIWDKTTKSWKTMTWNGLTDFYGSNVWSDGTNTYYSDYENSENYVLDSATNTWSPKTWAGLTRFNGIYVWRDGDNVYYSHYGTPEYQQYVLDKETSTWNLMKWDGLTAFEGTDIWTDNKTIYYSEYRPDGTGGFVQMNYMLNKDSNTWSQKPWDGVRIYNGRDVWYDGNNIYYSAGTNQAKLNNDTDEPFEYLYQYKIVNDPEYHYVYFDDSNTLHYDYECRIRFNLTTFNSATGKRDIGTSNWGSQNYLYQITLVSGQEMVDTIMEAKQGYPDLDWREDWPVQGANESETDYRNRMLDWLGTTQKDVFTFIKQRIPDYFQKDIDWNSPLGQIWVPQPILTPTKLQVDNNLRQII